MKKNHPEIDTLYDAIKYIHSKGIGKYLQGYHITRKNGTEEHISKVRGWLKFYLPNKADQITLWETLHNIEITYKTKVTDDDFWRNSTNDFTSELVQKDKKHCLKLLEKINNV